MTNNVFNALDAAKAKCLEEIGSWDENRELLDRLTDVCFDEINSLYALQDFLQELEQIMHS